MAHLPRQSELFAQAIKARIIVSEDHELVRLERALDWDEMIEDAMDIRSTKIKAATGPEPHYRELLGAVALMAVKNITYRDAEDLIAHYAPARYLCRLMDSDWRPDHITIFEFTQMLGEAGMNKINNNILGAAMKAGVLDSSRLMSDTTAQEAKIPYPNEVGLMSRYAGIVKKAAGKAGKSFSKVRTKIKEVTKKIKGLVRASHLFAKTKEQKRKVGKKLYHVSMEIHRELVKAIESGASFKGKSRLELVCPGLFDQRRCALFGQTVLHGGHPSSSGHLRTRPERLWFRPGWVQSKKYQAAKKMGVKHVGIAPQGKAVGSVPEHGGKNQARAGPGRGMHRNDQVTNLWIQQTRRQECGGNGNLWPTSNYRFQYAKTDSGADEVAACNDVNRKSEVQRQSNRDESDGGSGIFGKIFIGSGFFTLLTPNLL